MLSRQRQTIAAGLMLAAIALSAGCAAPSKDSKNARATTAANPPARIDAAGGTGTEPISNTDACVDQLHEAAGALLLYYGKNHRLPDDVRELAKLPGFDDLNFNCPVSHQPYIYDPHGLPGPSEGTQLILYDPAPSHGSAASGGMRLAVAVEEPHGNNPLVAKVIAVPEARFRLAAQSRRR